MSKRTYFPRGREGSEDDESIPDFSATLSSGLEETAKHRVLDPSQYHRPAELTWQNAMIAAQTEELRLLRAHVAKLTERLQVKASKRAFEEFSARVSAQVDKRLDSIRNWAMVGIGLIGAILAIVKVKG